MASLLVYLGVIALGVILAFYGLKNRKWLMFFLGLIVAVFTTYSAGII